MKVSTALFRMFLAACCAFFALAAEAILAAFFNWIGFTWPERLLLKPGENLYLFLVEQGFYAYSGQLLVDMVFAVKLDLVLNFLLLVWIFFSFPGLLERWNPVKVSPQKLDGKYGELK